MLLGRAIQHDYELFGKCHLLNIVVLFQLLGTSPQIDDSQLNKKKKILDKALTSFDLSYCGRRGIAYDYGLLGVYIVRF